MKLGFYPRLAITGIRKNKQMYFPYLLTFICMVTVNYIVDFLSRASVIASLRGGDTLSATMTLGVFVLAIFSAIFLFYTNAFLIRRRNKEFGLYNVLGMGKWNIAKMLFWETFFVLVISLLIGFTIGIVLSKLAELLLFKITYQMANFSFEISYKSLYFVSIIFCIISVLLYFRSLWSLRKNSAVQLLKSENVGEKPPKGNWFIGLLGIIILSFAYYLAVSIESPIAALMYFFIAVILVIIATYMIFISGSVSLCRIMQKNKNYYYSKKHFISLSSMIYRMKRNGAGLASICILATMVLVTFSSTTCLYYGTNDIVSRAFPRNIDLNSYTDIPMDNESHNAYLQHIGQYFEEKKLHAENIIDIRSFEITGLENRDGSIEVDSNVVDKINQVTLSGVKNFVFIPLEDYNKSAGTNLTLKDDECFIFKGSEYKYDRLEICDVKFSVKGIVDRIPVRNDTEVLVNTVYVVISNFSETGTSMGDYLYAINEIRFSGNWDYCFDLKEVSEEQYNSLARNLCEKLDSVEVGTDYCYIGYAIQSEELEYQHSLNGGLFFLGVICCTVFMFAAVLIVYYKQISEGFEDSDRFAIMQKVGMKKEEIRKSINSQLLTVFFLPLLFAGFHMCFAFPFINKVLVLFGLVNKSMLILITTISFVVFGLFYCFVYKITSNAYYHIVSN